VPWRRKAKKKTVEFASDAEMSRREAAATEFFRVVFGPAGPDYSDYRLAFVSDEAALWDVNGCATEEEVIERVLDHYGVPITTADFSLPFWQLLDRLGGPSGEGT
jgi:hypothetical protein